MSNNSSRWKKPLWLLLGVAGAGFLLWWSFQDHWKTFKEFENWIWSACIIAFLIYLSIFWIFTVPQVLNKLAEKGRFIIRREENTWTPIENSAEFERSLLVCHGKRLADKEKRDSTIEDIQEQRGNFFVEWLRSKGFEWVGWHSPGITKPGKMLITVTHKRAQLIEWSKVPDAVFPEDRIIHSLRIDFPVFVLVREVELSDGSLASFLYRAQIKVINPGLFWYGQGGKGFDSLIIAIDDAVSHAAQPHSLDEFYEGQDGHKGPAHEQIKLKLEEFVSTDTSVKEFGKDLGVQIRKMDRDSWVNNASADYIKYLQGPAHERIKEKTFNARAEAEKAREKSNTNAAKADKARGGGDENLGKLAMEVSIAGQDGYQARLRAEAFKGGLTGNTATVFAPGASLFDAWMGSQMTSKQKKSEGNSDDKESAADDENGKEGKK